MKTKFNCLLVSFIISTCLFSCKTRKVEIIEQMKEKEEAAKAAENSVFRPKRIFISTDSSTFRLVFENEYDELGRLKTENYYPDTNNVNGELNVLYRRELSYNDKLISTKSFVITREDKRYGQIAWDSTFYENGNKINQKRRISNQVILNWNTDSLLGLTGFFNFTYSTSGDTLIENQKGMWYNQASKITRYFDKNNVAVKHIDSAGCISIDKYKLEGSGTFASRYVLYYSFGENNKLFSLFERKLNCQSEEQKIVNDFRWSFDSQGRPSRLTLIENVGGVITKSYYRYEY